MYEWFWGIFAKKSKLHDAGGPDTMVSPHLFSLIVTDCLHLLFVIMTHDVLPDSLIYIFSV